MVGVEPGHNLVPAIVGPTASGKGALALKLADAFDASLVSVDSRKIYRGMDIGTAKPPKPARARFGLVDIRDPDERYSAEAFARDAEGLISSAIQDGRVPLLVGGTVLYFKALFEGFFPAPPVDRELRRRLLERVKTEGGAKLHAELSEVDPASGARIHPNDWVRIERALEIYLSTGTTMSEMLAHRRKPLFAPYYITVPVERDSLYRQINERVDRMAGEGLAEEVRGLLDRYGPDAPGLRTIGYQEMADFLAGRMSSDCAVQLIKKNTRTYARKQIYFMRSLGELHSPEEGEGFVSGLARNI